MTAIAISQRPAGGPRRAGAPRPVRPVQPCPVSAARRPARAARRRPNVALRRRIAALLVVVALALAVSGAWAMRSEASSDPGAVLATVVVAPGETVWDIALAYLPEGRRPQVYVAEILRHNDVDPAAIAPGTVLQLPRP